jgi:hypothetical protein
VLGEARIPHVVETISKPPYVASTTLDLSEQQRSSVRSDPSSIEGTNNVSDTQVSRRTLN